MAERNPQASSFQLPAGYNDLGWQVNRDRTELTACREAGHKKKEFDNSLYRYRCTDLITICDDCKYVHHTDMSD